MNSHQAIWWEQARSDWRVFNLLLRSDVEPCHRLHYLQMATEKLTKAHLWRDGVPPPPRHAGFVNFLRGLRFAEEERKSTLAAALGFRRLDRFHAWIARAVPIAHEVENLAPALARNGPNPEYPWPHEAPEEYPAGYRFDLWERLVASASGRQFLRFIGIAIDRFPAHA